MNKQWIIKLLLDDLKNEYKHMHFYIYSSCRVQGLHREEMSEFLYEAAQSEMNHIKEFSNIIIGLGDSPHIENHLFVNAYTDIKAILQYAIDMENEVVNNYTNRIAQA